VGAELLPAVKRLIEDLDQLVASSSDIAALGRGRVDVAAPTLQAAMWLPRVIEEFRRLHPNIRVGLHDVPENEIHRLVREGAVDIGVSTASTTEQDLRAQVVFSDNYHAMLHTGHPLAQKKEITWRDLVGLAVIGPLPGNPFRQHLDRMLAREGMALKYAYEVALPWTRLGLARAKLGVAVSTAGLRSIASAMSLQVRPVTRPTIGRDLVLIVSRDRSLSPSAEQFRELMLQRKPG
jgi:LysR family carnitine catabolism transcriptional activator